MKPSLLPAALVVLALPAVTSARTWLIQDDGSGDAPTIQAGIDSAATADTLLLVDGTYTGPGNHDIDFTGKAITVRSQSGDCNLCVIDCDGSSGDPHRGFLFHSGESGTSVLEGITITDGYRDYGGAVACSSASPAISMCCFTGNTASVSGGAVDFRSSNAHISNCRFLSNESLARGGAMHIASLSPTISGCTFGWNTAATHGGAMYLTGTSPTIEECSFKMNRAMQGGAMYMDSWCPASISYCSFWKNRAGQVGGAIRTYDLYTASPTLENCTFAADSCDWTGGAALHIGLADAPGLTNTLIAFSRGGKAISCDFGDGALGLACCDIYGNEGGDWVACVAMHADVNGNHSSDPLFCNLPGADLTVEDCSPCLGGNNSCGVDIGSRGPGCGCGEATEPTTWGAVKARYR